jgi:hypothetical protein
MMHVRSIETAAAGRIMRLRLDGAADKRSAAEVAEQAFESFAVMLWQMALAQDSISGWARACEHLYTVRLFLDRMRLNHLAEMASDLMAIAGCHAEAGARPSAPMVGKSAVQEAARTRAF